MRRIIIALGGNSSSRCHRGCLRAQQRIPWTTPFTAAAASWSTKPSTLLSFFSSSSAASCWKCGAPLSSSSSSIQCTPLCDACGAVQPLDDACTFFSLFGMERAVDIDGGELEKRFKDLQRGLHPDKFAYRQQQQQQQQRQQGSGSSFDEELDEVALSAAASARVNKAYQTLRRPLDRVKYVLEQEGITVLSESGGGTREATGGTGGGGSSNASNAAFATSPALLMEVMELREEVEDFRAAKDADALKAMASSATARVDHCMAAITAWHAGHRARVGGVGGEVDPSSSSDAALDEIANEAVRLQYYSKIQEEIDTALEAVQ